MIMIRNKTMNFYRHEQTFHGVLLLFVVCMLIPIANSAAHSSMIVIVLHTPALPPMIHYNHVMIFLASWTSGQHVDVEYDL